MTSAARLLKGADARALTKKAALVFGVSQQAVVQRLNRGTPDAIRISRGTPLELENPFAVDRFRSTMT